MKLNAPWSPAHKAVCRVQEARHSVAHIQTLTRAAAGSPFLQLNPESVRPGSGSGFLWDAQHVVTNFHVVTGASQVKATLSNQQTYSAKVVGTDPNNDLAVLRLETVPSDVRPISLGTSHDLMVGQRVFAIGNPFGLDQTLTGASHSTTRHAWRQNASAAVLLMHCWFLRLSVPVQLRVLCQLHASRCR
jgi:S1-C subfamily serine protease